MFSAMRKRDQNDVIRFFFWENKTLVQIVFTQMQIMGKTTVFIVSHRRSIQYLLIKDVATTSKLFSAFEPTFHRHDSLLQNSNTA